MTTENEKPQLVATVVAQPKKVARKTVRKVAHKVTKNRKGVSKFTPRHFSRAKNPCQIVWSMCAKMKKSRRVDVVNKCVAQGVNIHTARTQYQRWFAQK